MLLPLQAGRHSSQQMADLVTFVTPEPALRFAELWSSPEGKKAGLQDLVQQVSGGMSRYTASGEHVKTGSSLVVARGRLHSRYMDDPQ